MGPYVLCRNVHTGLRQGKETGAIVSCVVLVLSLYTCSRCSVNTGRSVSNG